jgi:hypothetical protein
MAKFQHMHTSGFICDYSSACSEEFSELRPEIFLVASKDSSSTSPEQSACPLEPGFLKYPFFGGICKKKNWCQNKIKKTVQKRRQFPPLMLWCKVPQ